MAGVPHLFSRSTASVDCLFGRATVLLPASSAPSSSSVFSLQSSVFVVVHPGSHPSWLSSVFVVVLPGSRPSSLSSILAVVGLRRQPSSKSILVVIGPKSSLGLAGKG
ncbi:hypothetical protein TYRP_011899 [Tyrophagus putrescentiae]|nr:hypothetical protein TYRP_011899 [Tyrophagus putrescentiae]